MKILVFSDSHGNIQNIKLALNFFENIKTIIHLGDFIDDTNKIKSFYPDLNIYCVAGNNDFYHNNTESNIKLNDYNIFLTHGHKYDVYYTIDKLYYKALENNAKIVLFGHTHCKFIKKINDILILNPGSISKPRDSNVPSFALIEIQKNKVCTKFFGVLENNLIEI